MVKPNRGKSMVKVYARGRGTCPVCQRTGVKLLWARTVNGQQAQVCKRCKAT